MAHFTIVRDTQLRSPAMPLSPFTFSLIFPFSLFVGQVISLEDLPAVGSLQTNPITAFSVSISAIRPALRPLKYQR